MPTFSQNFSTFRDFLPCFISNLPTPHKFPFNPTRRTRAYAYIRACALSEFSISAFTLHLTPQQTVYQSFECEGKPCLHLHRNKLKNNTLHDFHCKKQVKAKGWNLHPQLTLAQDFTPKGEGGEGKNRKTLDSRACVRVLFIDMSRMGVCRALGYTAPFYSSTPHPASLTLYIYQNLPLQPSGNTR